MHSTGKIVGRWHGWSVYIPIDGFFFQDREAIYRIDAEFRQSGRRVSMTEQLTHIYDIHGRYLEHVPPRVFSGKGERRNDSDILIHFRGKGSVVNGSMYLFLDIGSDQLNGILAVRPRELAPPVAVKLLLGRVDQPMPTLDDLGIERIRSLV